MAGVSLGLKKKNNKVKIALSDPMGSALYSHIKENKLESFGSSITEGIGQGKDASTCQIPACARPPRHWSRIGNISGSACWRFPITYAMGRRRIRIDG